jgi:hypothetical protein
MTNLKKEVQELQDTLKNVMRKKVFSQDKISLPFDYKQKEKEYYKRELDKKLNKIKTLVNTSFSNISSSDKNSIEKIKSFLPDFEKNIKEENQSSIEKALEFLNQIKNITPELNFTEEQEKTFYLPTVPREIYYEIKTNFDELEACFENKCYRSSLILCGKILEIALHRKYFEITGYDLLEKSPDIGLGNLIAKMHEKGLSLDPGLPQQIHLINQLRVYSVHKKGQTFVPSKAQAHASILYTLDVLKKLFRS